MKIEDIKVGKRYAIDTAPLIASPASTGRTFTGVVSHKNQWQAYVLPDGHHSPLYIFANWFVRELTNEEGDAS